MPDARLIFAVGSILGTLPAAGALLPGKLRRAAGGGHRAACSLTAVRRWVRARPADRRRESRRAAGGGHRAACSLTGVRRWVRAQPADRRRESRRAACSGHRVSYDRTAVRRWVRARPAYWRNIILRWKTPSPAPNSQKALFFSQKVRMERVP